MKRKFEVNYLGTTGGKVFVEAESKSEIVKLWKDKSFPILEKPKISYHLHSITDVSVGYDHSDYHNLDEVEIWEVR